MHKRCHLSSYHSSHKDRTHRGNVWWTQHGPWHSSRWQRIIFASSSPTLADRSLLTIWGNVFGASSSSSFRRRLSLDLSSSSLGSSGFSSSFLTSSLILVGSVSLSEVVCVNVWNNNNDELGQSQLQSQRTQELCLRRRLRRLSYLHYTEQKFLIHQKIQHNDPLILQKTL